MEKERPGEFGLVDNTAGPPIRIFYDHKEKLRTEGGVYPTAYSLHNDWVTPVKRQPTKNCWAYAATAMLETFLLRHNLLLNTDPLYAEYRILSETHMTYSMFDLESAELESQRNPYGVKQRPDGKFGASIYEAVAYLARAEGGGCVAECADPRPVADAALSARSFDITSGKPQRFLVTGVRYLEESVGERPDPDFIEDIKYCLLRWGAVAATISFKNSYLSEDGPESYKYGLYCFEKPSANATLHGIAIVGWDDDCPKTAFSKHEPEKGGAFLVKDSLGTVKDGYYWLSYEDMALRSAYCITDVCEKYYAKVGVCKHYDRFGMTSFYLQDAQKNVLYTCVFSTSEDARLTSVGLFCFTPCLLKISIGEEVIVENKKLSWAGYHVINLKTSIALEPETDYALNVEYFSIRDIPVVVPLETKEGKYKNAQLTQGTCYIGGKDLTTLPGANQFGSIPLRAYLEYTADGARTAEADTAALVLPPQINGRMVLPEKTANNLQIVWRLEPDRIKEYEPGRSVSATFFTATSTDGHKRFGIRNNDYGQASIALLCAKVGSGTAMLRKLLKANLSAIAPYPFSATPVPNGGVTTTLSGSNAVPGATVTARTRGSTASNAVKERTAEVGEDGCWTIPDFVLYNPAGGWKEEYLLITVDVTVTADDNVLLCQGEQQVATRRPYDPDPSDPDPAHPHIVIVLTALGFICAACTLTDVGSIIKLNADLDLTLLALRQYFPLRTNAKIDGQGHTIEFEPRDTSIMDEGGSMEDLTVQLHTNQTAAAAAAGQVGGIARKIAKGSKIKNCHVKGRVSGFQSFGGLFYESEGVEVVKSSVDLNVTGVQRYAGVAVSLADSTVDTVRIEGSVQGAVAVAGVSLAMQRVKIKDVVLNLEVSAQSVAAGVAHSARDCRISQVNVRGCYRAIGSGGAAAGIAVKLLGDTVVSDCRVSARIEGEISGGVADELSDEDKPPGVNRCLSICALKGKRTMGIAPGIEGKTGRISACVAICSLQTGGRHWRVGEHCDESCRAFEGTVCGEAESFQPGNETVVSAATMSNCGLYMKLGWDLSGVWIFQSCPLLRTRYYEEYYDLPFARLGSTSYIQELGIGLIVGGYRRRGTQVSGGLYHESGGRGIPFQEVKEGLRGDEISVTLPPVKQAGVYQAVVISQTEDGRFSFQAKVQVKYFPQC